MFQYPGHDGAATADWPDKWWRVSPDQSPGPGMIDSGSTGEQQISQSPRSPTHHLYTFLVGPTSIRVFTAACLATGHSGPKLYSLGLPNTFFLGATE